MIKVDRVKIPSQLAKHEKKWLKRLLEATTRHEFQRAQAKYKHEDVKRALVEMFHGKCAYCESQIMHIDYGHIEHFVPKSGPFGHPELTFEWDNLLLACGRCNGAEFKGSQFPNSSEGGPILNPCFDDPDIHLSFEYDKFSKLANVVGKTPRGEISERILGLNRIELREKRSTYIRRILVLSIYAKENTEAARLLEDARRVNAEYLAFVRCLVH